MALRAFKTTFLIAIDQDESSEWDDEDDQSPMSLDEFKEWLNDALRVDVDTDGCGNPGFQSCDVDIDGLKELSPDQVKKLYGKEG